MKKTYIILWDRSDYGRLHIEAESEEEARKLFEAGEFHEKDLNIKGGQMDIVEISELAQ